MPSRKTRGVSFVVLVVGAVVVLGFAWPDSSRREPSTIVASSAPAPSAIGPSSAVRSPSANEPSHPSSRAPLRLAVHAPQDVSVGDVFQARIDIDSSASVRDLTFSIAYEKSRLALVGRSIRRHVRETKLGDGFLRSMLGDGDFAQHAVSRGRSSS